MNQKFNYTSDDFISELELKEAERLLKAANRIRNLDRSNADAS